MLYTGLFFFPRWKNTRTEATISWDVSGYYMYLPALFIYKDIRHCTFKDSILTKYYPTPDFQQAFIHEGSGNCVMKYTSGQAFLMSPWFFLGHAIALNSPAYEADGFSYPYQVCIGLGMLLYAFLGLFVLRKVLLVYFKDSTVAIALLALVAGSNYLNYATIDQAMTHGTLFMLYALLLWTTIQFYRHPAGRRALLPGAICGFATLIRPTEILSLLIPLLWGISTLPALRDRLAFFRQHPRYLLYAGVCFVLFVMIQPLYWKMVTGNWVVYSYQDQGFSWLHPHFYDYTFSYDSGWLRYSPMMILCFVGLVPFISQRKNVFAVVSFFLINYYVVIAWDVWQYGGRAMVQSYPILIFPLAALIEYAQEHRGAAFILYPVMLVFTYLNIWWTYNAHATGVQVANVSRAYYKATVGRWSATEEVTKLLDYPDRYKGDTQHTRVLYTNDFTTDTSASRLAEGIDGPSIFVDHMHTHAAAYSIPLPASGSRWFRASALFEARDKEWDTWRMPQFMIKARYKGKDIKVNGLRVHRLLDSRAPRYISMDMRLPDEPVDELVVTIANQESGQKTIIDNLKVVALD
jgi:hypothetical protein